MLIGISTGRRLNVQATIDFCAASCQFRNDAVNRCQLSSDDEFLVGDDVDALRRDDDASDLAFNVQRFKESAASVPVRRFRLPVPHGHVPEA